jgi:integrase
LLMLIRNPFLASRPISRPKSYNHLAGVLRRWLGWVAQQGEITAVPICPSPRRITSERLPFIFDPPLAKRLLALTSELHDTDRARARPATYRMIFALLYGLGLRVGEVTRLNVQDIDFRHDLLIIRSSKFDKSRLVPFGPKMALELQGYLQTRQTLRTDMQPDSPLFSFSQKSKPITKSPITQAFHQILPKLELNIPPGAATPRLHDLRHSFAVGTLLRWYRNEINPGTRLLQLSTFMGHVDPKSTAVYLTVTNELLCAASQRFERFVAKRSNQP